MSFIDVLSSVYDEDIAETLEAITDDEILSTLSKSVLLRMHLFYYHLKPCCI